MPGFLFHVGGGAMCPHGGQIQVISANARTLVGTLPVATLGDQYVVVGCPFNVAGAPHPCVRVQWIVPAARVLINGQPAITQASVGLCLAADGAPQGPPVITTTQPRVVAT